MSNAIPMKVKDNRNRLDWDVLDLMVSGRAGHAESYVVKNWMKSSYGWRLVTTRQVLASLRRLQKADQIAYTAARGWHRPAAVPVAK